MTKLFRNHAKNEQINIKDLTRQFLTGCLYLGATTHCVSLPHGVADYISQSFQTAMHKICMVNCLSALTIKILNLKLIGIHFKSQATSASSINTIWN